MGGAALGSEIQGQITALGPDVVIAATLGSREDDGSNLERFIDTQDSGFLGQLFDLAELRRWLESEGHGRA